MKIYSFKDVENVILLGSCRGEISRTLRHIKNGLTVKKEDEDEIHPKELEWQAKRKAQLEAMYRAAAERPQMRFGRPGRYGTNRIFNVSGPENNDRWTKFEKEAVSITHDLSIGATLCKNKKTLFIVSGDCGLGINKPEFYDKMFEKFNKIFSYNNVFLLLIRGNNDDPSYFDGKRINLSNIKAVPDYSVIETAKHNILCVGGAISVDRSWKIEQEKRINKLSPSANKKLYWENEGPIFNDELIKEVISEHKIDCVVSHSAPSFVVSSNDFDIEEWAENDSTLTADISSERLVMDKIFEHLRDNNLRPKYWAYSHQENENLERRSDTIFRSLSFGYIPTTIENDIEMLHRLETSHKQKNKKKVMSSKKFEEDLPDFGIADEAAPDHHAQRLDYRDLLREAVVENANVAEGNNGEQADVYDDDENEMEVAEQAEETVEIGMPQEIQAEEYAPTRAFANYINGDTTVAVQAREGDGVALQEDGANNIGAYWNADIIIGR